LQKFLANRYLLIWAVDLRSGGTGRRGTRLLIWTAGFGSSGPDLKCARGGGGACRGLLSHGGTWQTHRSSTFSVLRGSNRLWFGSGGFYASRVIHLGSQLGAAGAGAPGAAVGAALRRRSSPAHMIRPRRGSVLGLKGSGGLRVVVAGLGKACVGFWGAATSSPQRGLGCAWRHHAGAGVLAIGVP